MRGLALIIAGLLALVAVGWATLEIARRSVDPERVVVEEQIPAGAVEAVDALLSAATGTPMGQELPRRVQVAVGADQDAYAAAERLARQVMEQARLPAGTPAITAYASRENSLDADLRVYLGKTPTHHVTLSGKAHAAATATGRPWVALVVAGLGTDGPTGMALAGLQMPLSLAVVPTAPFALRLAQDALLGWKELLVDLPPDLPPEEALAGVPKATAWLLDAPVPALLPDPRMPVVQATGEVEPAAVREARGAGVPVLRAETGLDRERVRGLARGAGELVWVVPASEGLEAARWLQAQPDLRPVFVSEIAEAQRQRPRTAP